MMDSSGSPYFGRKPCCSAMLLKLAKSPTIWWAVMCVTPFCWNLSTAAWMSEGEAKTDGQPKLYVTSCDDGTPACWNQLIHLLMRGLSQSRYVNPTLPGMAKKPRSLRANTAFLSRLSNSLMLKRYG